ncbi:wall-associated protein precursor [Bacillus sp. JCM 19045]|nr:wall-associated protein precursor [Bacillus sp. JCM 19045]
MSIDPDPGDEDDIITQNGYTYANYNPVMLVDPDGHWVWLAVNAGFAAYDGYKAYKAGKGWKGAAWAAASNFGPGKVFKGAKKALGFAKSGGNFNWKHIKGDHGSKSKKKKPNGSPKSKFKSTKSLKRTTRATGRAPVAYTQDNGRTVHFKTFKKPIGKNTRGKLTKTVKVVKSGNFVVLVILIKNMRENFSLSIYR